ncbi:MAG TPA: hypothetical protein VIW68_10210, partial [Candidatus Sulfotelmatobacter sp.]
QADHSALYPPADRHAHRGHGLDAGPSVLGRDQGEHTRGLRLNDLKVRIEEKIKADGLDAVAVKGKIGLRSGKLLGFVTPSTPDDPVAIAKLKQAAKEILNINL